MKKDRFSLNNNLLRFKLNLNFFDFLKLEIGKGNSKGIHMVWTQHRLALVIKLEKRQVLVYINFYYCNLCLFLFISLIALPKHN